MFSLTNSKWSTPHSLVFQSSLAYIETPQHMLPLINSHKHLKLVPVSQHLKFHYIKGQSVKASGHKVLYATPYTKKHIILVKLIDRYSYKNMLQILLKSKSHLYVLQISHQRTMFYCFHNQGKFNMKIVSNFFCNTQILEVIRKKVLKNNKPHKL